MVVSGGLGLLVGGWEGEKKEGDQRKKVPVAKDRKEKQKEEGGGGSRRFIGKSWDKDTSRHNNSLSYC